MTECVSCRCSLGVAAGEYPFTAHDGETWCPQCFAHKRACLEPDRYYPGGFNAVACLRCKAKTVAIGGAACAQCGAQNTIYLAPKPDVPLGDTGGITKQIIKTLVPRAYKPEGS